MATPEPSLHASQEPSLGSLVHDLTQQMSTLVRDEIRLAQAEMTQKGKRAGIGVGMFGAAGVVALFGIGALVTTAILALALVLAAWLAALIVAVLLFVVAGVVAMMGKSSVSKATPAKPEQAIGGIKEDIATVKGERGHEHV
jgi:putative superfamily III holin-X